MNEFTWMWQQYQEWRSRVWPLQRWSADAAVIFTLAAILIWITK